MRRGSLRTRLIAWNIVTLALLLGLLATLVRYTVTTLLLRSVDRALTEQLTQPLPGSLPDPRRRRRGDDPRFTLVPRYFDLDGRPLGSRSQLSPESFAVAARHAVADSRRIVFDGEPTQILSLPLYRRNRLVGVGQVGYRLTEIEAALATLDTTLFLLLPIGLLCAAGGGVALTDRVLRRIREATRAARGTSARLPVSGNDEFAELAGVLNALLERQETALQQQRRFTADASHELQSPLTVVKGTASMALESDLPFSAEQYRRSLREIDLAADAMVSLVQDLLLLAHSDSDRLGKQPIEILVSEVLERAVRLVRSEGAAVTLQVADPGLTVWGNEGELIRLFANLVGNAVRYTPRDGSVRVTAAEGDSELIVAVADTGPGIAPEHVPHLGERFYRVESSRIRGPGGTGLGLSICRSIVAAHGGTIEIATEVGVGTVVTVRLPRRVY